MSYSQNNEEQIISRYFGDFKGTLLDAGANDGITFSNSRALLLNGWSGHLFEPSSVVDSLFELYKEYPNVNTYDMGIGANGRIEELYESGAHVKGGTDRALVSTTIKSETSKWIGVDFRTRQINIIAFEHWHELQEYPILDFITIDIEGMDWELLQAIDLTNVGCKCLCIEWNSDKKLGELFKAYCAKHGMKLLHTNAENMIFTV